MKERLHAGRPASSAVWLGVAVVLAGLAISSFVRRPQAVWDGLVLALGAVAFFALAFSAAEERPVARWPSLLAVAWDGIAERPWRGVALLAAMSLLASALHRLPQMSAQDDYTSVVLTWGLAFFFYTLAVAPPRPRPRHDWSIWWEVNRWNVLVLATIVGLAFLLRTWGLDRAPATLSGDEAAFGREVMRVLRGELRNPFTTGWLSQPTMGFFYVALFVRWLGLSVTALRLPWAILGTASVLVTFWLVSRLKGVRLGMVTAALLATYHLHVHYSRLHLNNIADPFVTALALLLLTRALDRHSPLDWVLVGASTAAGLYVYTGGRLVILIVAAVMVYAWVGKGRRFWTEYRTGLLTAVGSFLIVAAPMLQFALRFPDEFNGRINQVGIIQSGWLSREVVVRGQSAWGILWDQFQRAALAFLFYPDRSPFYGLPGPLLDPLFGTLFVVGLLYATLRLLPPNADRRLFPMVAWWWGGVIFGGMLTESPPSSHRLVTLSVPTCFFVALALWRLALLAQRALYAVRSEAVLATGVVLFGLLSVRTYFWDYIPSAVYGGPVARLATQVAPVLRPLSATHNVYVVAAPWFYWEFPTFTFLVPDAQAVNLVEPIQEPPVGLVPEGRGAVFILVPARADELTLIRQAYPAGYVEEIRLPPDGDVAAILYVVPPE